MRELVLPVISLGSAGMEKPDAADVAEWIRKHTGRAADITTYQLDRLFSRQTGVDEPAAGGEFYAPRICAAFGADNQKITQEFTLELDEISEDFRFIPKKTSFSLPSFSSLELEDSYFHDDDEFAENGISAFKKLTRELRDRDVQKIILHAKDPSELELELLTGRKYLWKTTVEHLEAVLETTRDLVLPCEDIRYLVDLFDSYEIRNLYLLDATADAVSTALELFDKEYLYSAGYAPADADEIYWNNLSELKTTVEKC